MSRLLLQRLPRKVIQRIRQRGEGQHADIVVIEERVREVEDVAFADGGFIGFEGDADQADDAAGGDQSGGEKRAGRDFAASASAPSPCRFAA